MSWSFSASSVEIYRHRCGSPFCKWRNRYCAAAKWRSLVPEGNLHTLLRNCFRGHPGGFSLHSVACDDYYSRRIGSRGSNETHGRDIGREWFRVIAKIRRFAAAYIYVYICVPITRRSNLRHRATKRAGTDAERPRCVTTVQRGKSFAPYARSHYQSAFCNPAICPSTASYN